MAFRPRLALAAALLTLAACGSGKLDSWRGPLRGAPEPVRRMTARMLASESSHYPEYQADEAEILALGPAAVPWLVKIVEAPSSEKANNLQLRSNAAQMLSRLGRTEELLAFLESPRREVSSSASLVFSNVILNRPRGEWAAWLPRIERVAASSPFPLARADAMMVLHHAGPEYAPVCRGNLDFSSSALNQAAEERGLLADDTARRALGAFSRLCAEYDDYEAHTHAIRCLKILDDAASLPQLLSIAEAANAYTHRHDAIIAMSAIARADFGTPVANDGSHSFTDTAWDQRCAEERHRLKGIVESGAAAAEAAREFEQSAARLRGRALRDAARDPDASIVAGWRAHLSRPGFRRPERDAVVATRASRELGLLVNLYASGKVEMISDDGRSVQEDFLSLLQFYVESPDFPLTEPKKRAGRWLKESVEPAFQAARKHAKPHAAGRTSAYQP
jgi:hypothetical protein